MKKIISFALSVSSLIATAQNKLNIVPQPADIKTTAGNFTLNNKAVIVAQTKPQQELANLLNFYLKGLTGLNLPVKSTIPTTGNYILFSTVKETNGQSPESYSLNVTKNKIEISASTGAGAFYGIQTITQLVPVEKLKSSSATSSFQIPELSIFDYPRFAYRGMHLDVCRHFFSVQFIKKYIDYLATYKFNKFHWHLTDDQGWRIEIKRYPLLTTIGANRNGTIIGRYPGKGNDNKPYGGYYTQEQIKEVVQYAKERFIEVIPEIEMPGHGSAAIAAYPWLSCFPNQPTDIPSNMISKKSVEEQKNGRIKLVQETWGVFDDVFCAGKDSTFQFLENVIDEVIKLFPSKYFHIGGDECPKTNWKKCPVCQQRMKENNLKDEHELQSWFVQHMEKYLNNKGKIMIGWDEILEGGLAPNAVVMSWRGEDGGIEAAKQQHPVIMTPGNPVYFDHTQSKNEDSVTIGGYNPLEKVYAYEPIPKTLTDEQGKYILGAQANMWAEYIEYPSKVEYMMFPRMTALSEVLWSPKNKRDWKDYERRLPAIFKRLDKQKINYSKAYYNLNATVMPSPNFNGVLWKLESKNNSPISINFNNADSVWKYTHPQLITKDVFLANAISNSISLSQKFSFNKATGKKITIVNPPSKSYPGNGAFTLVDGIQNEKGMSKSSEFLGFNGTDLNVTIDLGKDMEVSKVILHVLKQPGSWIYLPKQVEVTYIPYFDTTVVTRQAPLESISVDVNPDGEAKTIEILGKKTCRYIQVKAINYGIIPTGKAGAGNPAWLFTDEIEVQ